MFGVTGLREQRDQLLQGVVVGLREERARKRGPEDMVMGTKIIAGRPGYSHRNGVRRDCCSSAEVSELKQQLVVPWTWKG
jgi:hypothetical protein